MALEYVIPAGDREAFLGCRRAWDFGARERGDREPATSSVLVDQAAAIRQALAVYYFPGMWDWQPHLVLRLVRMAFLDALTAQRTRYLRDQPTDRLSEEQEHAWTQARDEGLTLLEHYFTWAPTVDALSPGLVGAEFDVQIPDPARPGRNLVTPDGRAVHYRDRVDLLMVDASDAYWMVEHRVVDGPFPELDLLRLAERCLSWCWAWELFYPGMRIEGTVYNELRNDLPLAAATPASPAQRGSVPQHQGTYLRPWSQAEPRLDDVAEDLEPSVQVGEAFRRVVVPRARAELAGFGDRLAAQATAMADPATDCHPTPAIPRCAACAFRAPCRSMNLGEDPTALLGAGYVAREHGPARGQLGGGSWSTGRGAAPPDFSGGPRRTPGTG